jgi:hypothetical protein
VEVKSNLYSVALVVDRNFGTRLSVLAARLHVWIVESPPNRAALQDVWRNVVPEYSLERGATIFSGGDASGSPDQVAAGVLGDIDLHHGEHSHDPPLARLEIYGTGRTALLLAALEDRGFLATEDLVDGFSAIRAVSDAGQPGVADG